MSRSKLAIVILAFAIVATSVLRIAGAVGKRTIAHDEGISYLSATGHQGDYFRVIGGLYPFGTWVQASEWKKFIYPEKLFCFKQIGFDLAHFDIQPPLYFWLLHLWSLMFGVHLWTGPSLNILIALVATLFLFGLARYTLCDSMEAALVAFMWTLSPAVIPISFEARQYDLLALCTILFVWQVIKCADLTKQPKLRASILLVILTTTGALTHYHFSIVVMGCSIFLIAKLVRENRHRLMAALASIGMGYVISFLLHPHFYLSFQRQQAQAEAFRYKDIIPRVRSVISSFLAFFVYGKLSKYIFLGLLSIIIIYVIIVHYNRILNIGRYIYKIKSNEFYIVYLFLWIAGATILLYLTFLSPGHAMGGRYLSMVWPFCAFIPVFLLRFGRKFRVLLTICFCVSLLLFGSASVLHPNYVNSRKPDPAALLKSSDVVVVDNVARGILPRIFWHVPDDKLMFAASQDYLLDHQDIWLSRLDGESVYISELSYENTATQREKILDLISQEYEEIVPIEGGIWGLGDVFKIQK